MQVMPPLLCHTRAFSTKQQTEKHMLLMYSNGERGTIAKRTECLEGELQDPWSSNLFFLTCLYCVWRAERLRWVVSAAQAYDLISVPTTHIKPRHSSVHP